MFCKYCGEKIDEEEIEKNGQVYCTHCGGLNKKEESFENDFKKFSQENKSEEPKEVKNPSDTGSFWWGVLGFFIPLAGLLLFILWQKNYPKNAKLAGIGALVSVICEAIFYVVIIIILSASGVNLNEFLYGYA
ncbi:MAG: hypothetical protein IJ837_03085 [Clostridia bacterium]|nr:hypothetical protein [Clostridia bacterium]